MAKISIACPKCKAIFKVDENHIGKKGICTKCNERFVISRPQESETIVPTNVQRQIEATQTVEATVKQAEPSAIAETIPAAKAEQAGSDIAATIAAPAQKDAAEIQREEQDIPAEWKEGQTILDLYEVKQVFRTGGMGLVYRVHHKNWNMDLAVKSPRADYFKTEVQKENFIKECETWINLGLHPNIVSCYYVRTLGGIPRVFAEYVDGGSLKDWIENKKLYDGGKEKALERILDIAIQFAWGLHYAHEHEEKLVHQDVKPANVMMTEDGTAKVTDFGLAKARAIAGEAIAASSQQSILVSSGGMTPAYCSPEQANKQSLSRKTDIWSWGLSVLEMFAGEVFWRAGQAAPEALKSYIETGVEDEAIPKMPEALIGLLKQCFQQNPEDRPKDMQEVTAKLKDIYKDITGKEYVRPEPKPAELLADGLNNKAVSMLDLGRKEEAEKLYEQALEADPHHPDATYNRGLLLWRSGRMTDGELVSKLEGVRTTHEKDWQDEYLLGLVHLERGDAEAAVNIFEAVSKERPENIAVLSALTIARNMIGTHGECLRTLKWGQRHVSTVTFSPDRRYVIAGTKAGGRWSPAILLWELENVKTAWEILLSADCESLTISPDGRHTLIAIRRFDINVMQLWDIGNKKCVRKFEGGNYAVRCVAISPDGRLGISGSSDSMLRLWDLATGKCVKEFKNQTGEIYTVAFSSEGRFVLSGGHDQILRLWDIKNGNIVQIFKGHTGYILSVSVSSDGRFALSGSYDDTLRLWDLATGKCVRELYKGLDSVRCCAISPNGQFALSGHLDCTVRLWELVTGKCVRTYYGHSDWIDSVAFSSDGHLGLSGDYGGTVRVWRLAHGSLQPFMLSRPCSSMELSQKAADVAQLRLEMAEALSTDELQKAYKIVENARLIPGYEKDRALLDLREQSCLVARRSNLSSVWICRTFTGHTDLVTSVSLSNNGSVALSGSYDTTLRLWECASGKCIRLFQGHNGPVSSVKFLDGCRRAISASEDKTLKLWDITTGECIRTFEGHTSPLNSVCVSPDGQYALSGIGLSVPEVSDCAVRMWDIGTGKCLKTFEGDRNSIVRTVEFSPDGRMALASGLSDMLWLWDITTGCCLRRFYGDKMETAVFSADGHLVVSISHRLDETMLVWDIAVGKCLSVFGEKLIHERCLAFSPDNRFVLAGGKSLKLWDITTGQCLRVFRGHIGSVISVTFSKSGRFVLSGTSDGILQMWELIWDHEFLELVDWDEGAKPYLEIFLTLHCPYGSDGISRVGRPTWNDRDFKKLLTDLQYRGYGWLRPGGVRKKLEEMTANWQGPPPLPRQHNEIIER